MALSPALNTREFDKFAEVNSETAVRVSLANAIVSEKYDFVSFAYPDSVTEAITFKFGGSGGTTVATVTIVYTDSSKENISTVTRT